MLEQVWCTGAPQRSKELKGSATNILVPDTSVLFPCLYSRATMDWICSGIFTYAQSDWNRGNSWALCHIPLAIPEQFWWCGWAHCSAVGSLPSGSTSTLKAVHGWRWCLGGWCMSSHIHMTAITQGFPAEYVCVYVYAPLYSSVNSHRSPQSKVIIYFMCLLPLMELWYCQLRHEGTIIISHSHQIWH